MYNHTPSNYACPFCLLVEGIETVEVWSKQQDIVFRNESVTAFVSASWWPHNPGHVLIIPNTHFENIYDLPCNLGAEIFRISQRISLAMKSTYNCDGISTRQHNEPAGNQHVWHYHLHIFPRYKGDNLYLESNSFVTTEQRLPYAIKLREALNMTSTENAN